MTTATQILAQLSATGGQATASAIAGGLHQPAPVVAGYLEDLDAAGHVTRRNIAATLDTWSITDAGRQFLAKPTPATP